MGNERADSLTGEAVIDNNITIDPPTVVQCVTDQLIASRPLSSSYNLSRLKEKGVQPGDGATCNRRGRQNQLLIETISLQKLPATLMTRDEQASACPACYVSNVDNTKRPSNHRKYFKKGCHISILYLTMFVKIFRISLKCVAQVFLFFEIHANMHCLLLGVQKLQNHYLKANNQGS